MKTIIHHWGYNDGWHTVPSILTQSGEPEKEFCEELVGWHCWVYCEDHNVFLAWMKHNCPGADCTTRFNGGNPMVTVNISDQDEAAYFMLNFDV